MRKLAYVAAVSMLIPMTQAIPAAEGSPVASAAAIAQPPPPPPAAALAAPAAPAAAMPAALPPTNVTGTLPSGNTTWTPANSPYVITANVIVPNDGVLTMLPGTVVKIATSSPSGAIQVRGQLVANGTAANPIVITSLRDDSMLGDTNGDGAATVAAPGNYGVAIGFVAPSGTDAIGVASQRATSLLDNVAVRYGGADSGGNCTINTALVEVDRLSRVAISRSEFVHSAMSGLTSGAPGADAGIGSLRVESSRFADYAACGVAPHFGEFTNNIFEDAGRDGFKMDVGAADHLTFSGNWFYGALVFYGDSGYGRDVINFHDNAFLAAWPTFNGQYQYPEDLSGNYWLLMVSPPPKCYDATFQPPLYRVVQTSGGCPGAVYANNKYFTTITPAIGPPPSVVAGLSGSPVVAGLTDLPQLNGVGSEFAARPAGMQSDPVNTATGSYVDQVVDAAVPALNLGLSATRSYNSIDTASIGSLGRGWAFAYDISLAFASPTVTLNAGDGQQVRFQDNGNGTFTGAPGATATLTGNSIAGYDVKTRAGLVYHFSSAGKIQTLSDRTGATVTFTYAAGKLSQVANGTRTLTYTYTGDRLTRVTLGDGRYVEYGYTGDLLTSVRDTGGHTSTYEYTGNRLTREVDPLGHQVVKLAYNATTGRVSDQWDPLNNHTTFGWNPATGTATMTDPRGGVWTDVYSNNVIRSRTDALGRTTTYAYDADLQLVSTMNTRGSLSRYYYNAAGDMVRFSGPAGDVVTSYTNHNPVKTTNARGHVTTYDYWPSGLLKSVTRPGANVTSYTYDANQQLSTVVDPESKTTTYAYWPTGDLKSVTTPLGKKTSYTYDSVGRKVTEVSPRGNAAGATPADFTTTYTYTNDDQIGSVLDPIGRTSSSQYDNAGRLTSTTDPKNRVTTYTYDDAGHVLSVQSPDPTVSPVTTTYDANGNKATVTDENGKTTTYTYDLNNQPTKAVSTAVGTYDYTYDKGGNLASVKGPDNNTTLFQYTESNQLRKIDYPGSTTIDVTYSYDPNGNRRTMSSTAGGSTSYSYDARDQLTGVTSGSNTFTYTYNPRGGMTSATFPTGTVQYMDYDDDGRLVTVQRNATLPGAKNPVATYTYNDDGAPLTSSLANGTVRTNTYDRANQLTGVRDVRPDTTKILDDTYILDLTGNPTRITHNGSGTSDTYTYDALDQLTGACYSTTTCTGATDYVKWTYDDAGNRLTEQRPAGTTNYSYNATTGRLASTTGPAGTTNYVYDTLGQLTSTTGASAATYVYNTAGRMTSATAGGTATTYTYDGDGRRITSATGGVTQKFLWDPISYQLAAETTSTGARIRDYLYGNGPLGFLTPTSTMNYYHLDGQGSVREVDGPTANAQWRYNYEPFGVVKSATKIDSAAVANPIQWAGQYTDAGGSSHLRARQYDPTTGRFLAADPAGATTVSGTYAYANNNPMTSADPLGLWGISLSGAWDTITSAAPTVALVAGAAAMIPTPLSPVFGGIALAAGAITAVDSAYDAYQVCSGSEKGSCSAAIAESAFNTALALPGARVGASAVRSQFALRSSGIATRTESRALSRVEESVCNCFVAGTKVRTSRGPKPIQKIRVGDQVWAKDLATGRDQLRTVTALFRKHADRILTITIAGKERVKVTPEHPFHVEGTGWVMSRDLRVGDRLTTRRGGQAAITSIISRQADVTVFNFTVAGDHNYFVSRSQLLVHNCALPKKNNIVRVGPAYPGGPFRVSLGAQQKHWAQLPSWRQKLQPFHLHMERGKGGLTYNPTGRSWRLWGGWQ